MITFENEETVGWEHAIRGMRNPMNSWAKSDSVHYCGNEKCTKIPGCDCNPPGYHVGKNDHDLMMKLSAAGTDHRKFMRQLVVYADIVAPLYWWKEFDTYKVGTVANSCSTMHKIQDKEFTREDFSCEHLVGDGIVPDRDPQDSTYILDLTIESLNYWRGKFLEYDFDLKTYEFSPDAKKMRTADRKRAWWQMIQLLPSSYNQKRTVMLNYEVLANIYRSRKNHKLDEWHAFCEWIEGLPHSELITGQA